jgi:hypothetical protein
MTRFGHTTRTLLLGAFVAAAALFASFCAAAPSAAQQARGATPAVEKQHPKVDFDVPCQECHTRRTPTVVRQWQESRHSPNVGCFICHGDGEVEFHAKPSTQSCMSCHSAKVEDMPRAPVRDCFACHNSHRLKFHR